MPVLSMFYGIIVRMYMEKSGRHNMPHIHAEYSGEEVVVAIDGTMLEGSIPSAKMKLLEAWMEIHRDDLTANWRLLANGEQYFRIDPLKQEGNTVLQPKITSLKTLPEYKLHLCYETGEERIFDVSPYIRGDWYVRLKDEEYFKTVHVLSDGTGIQWKDGHDIAPHELYDARII